MTKMLVINSKTKVITNVVDDENGYSPPFGRELVKGSGKVGETYTPEAETPPKPPAKKRGRSKA